MVMLLHSNINTLWGLLIIQQLSDSNFRVSTFRVHYIQQSKKKIQANRVSISGPLQCKCSAITIYAICLYSFI
ncbi:hypothetical protein FGO68_gene4066 [Halteria grandinella]|uniref:Uncharacterized protein n=1 Tax=Halteria grandinella TaxID=5974 RepID=A0A8J8SXH6_HALGN|nr:hypothetical protein FGO68_gene4066 [Halteria grandinella]